ncbi:LacI family DNA-binding transcriptional regulator [Crossiella cryophila]|uniref:DNA-binding LacI/PurR family transcriptional regulator n=1 Tax=Crossiella cryophila TaxID=43355 RepID=A0A7W7FWS1_9PSEU|nr:LacI family DNA-binding transcriptional regulator [Crossiella cryophila]MBB4680345.1 DNA-binding LacI/PurR family transcriptional regulator [Crossiella cryophila]
MTERPPTLDAVAQRAGVSTGTVSRVLNNAQHVSQKARQAVERAIEELGYVPNTAARSLAARRRGAVVLAISSEDPALTANLFFAEVITGVNAVIEETDLQLLLVLAASQRGQDRFTRVLHAADGVLLLALREHDPLSKLAADSGLPVVHGGQPLGHTPRHYVDADNRGGARLATEHLISLGRRRIATITGGTDQQVALARHLGYREALALAGLSEKRLAHGDFTESGGAAAMTRLLAEHPDLDAVFVASDAMAAGALDVLRERGRRVPEEVAVVGFNDIVTAQHTQPALTTVRQPIEALGREMTRMLIRLINGEQPTSLILPTELIRRDSA